MWKWRQHFSEKGSIYAWEYDPDTGSAKFSTCACITLLLGHYLEPHKQLYDVEAKLHDLTRGVQNERDRIINYILLQF
jgi:hypothetical protein